MVHLANASLNLATVVRSIWFPIQAGRAPDGTAICLADKCRSAVEVLQARRWFRSRRRRGCHTRITVAREASILPAFPSSIVPGTSLGASTGYFFTTLIALSLCFCFALSQSTPLTAAWNISGIDGNGKYEAGVGENEEEEKDRVCHKDANRWPGARDVESGGRFE